MASEAGTGWLGVLAAVWNADGLEAWIFKLVGVLVAVFLLTALAGLGAQRRGRSQAAARRAPRAGGAMRFNARLKSRALPPKNRKKKRERIVRRYRPRSHSGTLRPLTRRTALKLVERPAPASPLRRIAV
jgi:uncharacterized membrane protein